MLKLNEAPELQAKGVSYDRAMREVKRLRSWGLGPDFPPPRGRVGPHVAIAKRIKKAVGNAVKAYKVYGQLSAMHPKLASETALPQKARRSSLSRGRPRATTSVAVSERAQQKERSRWVRFFAALTRSRRR